MHDKSGELSAAQQLQATDDTQLRQPEQRIVMRLQQQLEAGHVERARMQKQLEEQQNELAKLRNESDVRGEQLSAMQERMEYLEKTLRDATGNHTHLEQQVTEQRLVLEERLEQVD